MIVKKLSWALLFVLAACTGTKDKASDTLRLGIISEPRTIDPRKIGDQASTLLSYMLYEGLTQINNEGHVCLAAAESVAISDDHKTYTFHIREATWSNGTPVSAKDFEYAWKTLLDKHFPSPAAYLFYPIQNAKDAKEGKCSVDEVGIYAKGEHTLVVELEKPTPYFLELVAFCSFFPVCYQEMIQNPGSMNATHSFPPTNGPFLLEKWQPISVITLAKNPKYWNKRRVVMEKVALNVIENPLTALQLFETGQLDWLSDPFLSRDVLAPYHKKEELKKVELPGLSFVAFNTKKGPFANQNIRKAFSYAVDRKSIASNLAQHTPAKSLIPPALRKTMGSADYFEEGGAIAHLERGLVELGLTKLPPIEYLYFNNDIEKRIAQALQNQWLETLGVEVELTCLDFKAFLDSIFRKKFTVAQFSASAQYFDAINMLERFATENEPKNYSSWHNKNYGEILESALLEVDKERRHQLYAKAEEMMMNELPICPLFFLEQVCLQQKNLTGIRVNPIGIFDFRSAKFTNQDFEKSL